MPDEFFDPPERVIYVDVREKLWRAGFVVPGYTPPRRARWWRRILRRRTN